MIYFRHLISFNIMQIRDRHLHIDRLSATRFNGKAIEDDVTDGTLRFELGGGDRSRLNGILGTGAVVHNWTDSFKMISWMRLTSSEPQHSHGSLEW